MEGALVRGIDGTLEGFSLEVYVGAAVVARVGATVWVMEGDGVGFEVRVTVGLRDTAFDGTMDGAVGLEVGAYKQESVVLLADEPHCEVEHWPQP